MVVRDNEMPMSMQNKAPVSTEVEQGAEIDATATLNALHSLKRYANTGKYSNCDNINAVDELEVLQSVDLIRTLPRTLREKRQAKWDLLSSITFSNNVVTCSAVYRSKLMIG